MGFDIRTRIGRDDLAPLRRITEATGFFYAEEVDVAASLAEDAIELGDASEYHFVLADAEDELKGFSCYGPIACTKRRYDLYWIVVTPEAQGTGLGTDLLRVTIDLIRREQGARLYAETSSRALYEPTRQFYLRRGFREVARIASFYAIGDDKLIYELVLDDQV